MEVAEASDISSVDTVQEYTLLARHGGLEELEKYLKSMEKVYKEKYSNETEFTKHWNNFLNGADVESKNTALHMASANGHKEIVKLLVETYHVNMNVTNHLGNTPLHWAVMNNQHAVVAYLLENKADTQIMNDCGFTAAMEAQRFNYEDILQLFINYSQNK